MGNLERLKALNISLMTCIGFDVILVPLTIQNSYMNNRAYYKISESLFNCIFYESLGGLKCNSLPVKGKRENLGQPCFSYIAPTLTSLSSAKKCKLCVDYHVLHILFHFSKFVG